MINFMGYDEKKLLKIVHDWEREEFNKKILAIKEADKPKPIITLTEAINLFNKYLPQAHGAEVWVDFFIATGMLEVKEERKTTVCFMGKDDKYVEIWKENKLIKTIDLS